MVGYAHWKKPVYFSTQTILLIKLILSEKATKFDEISKFYLKLKFRHISVAFSQYLNFDNEIMILAKNFF